MSDFNAKVGEQKRLDVVGNDRGNRLVQFCQEEFFIGANTLCKHPARRLYTWTSYKKLDRLY